MNRAQRRAEQARQRIDSKRQAIGRAWAELVISQLVEASTGFEPNIEVGVVHGREIRNLTRVFLPVEFFKAVLLCRAIVSDGVTVTFTSVGPNEEEDGWCVAYGSIGFVIRGKFTSYLAQFKKTVLKLDFNSVISRAPRSLKYSGLRKYMIEELECEGFPIGFLNPFHPDPAVDTVLRETEAEIMEEFWKMSNKADKPRE